MSDMGALICVLRAPSPMQIPRHMGEAMQQLLVSRISRINPTLGKTLDPPEKVTLYAVSGLHWPDFRAPVLGDVQVGDEAWIRLVGLREDVVQALEDAFANEASRPAGVEIDKNFWILDSAYWESKATYQDLMGKYQRQAPPHDICLDFLTPTTFKVKGMDIPLPIPVQIFSNLERRWREVSGYGLPRELNAFIEYFGTIDALQRLNTVHLRLQGDHQVGFLGQMEFKIKPSSEQLEKDVKQYHKTREAGRETHRYQEAYELKEFLRQGQNYKTDLARGLGLLAEFATYAGVGRKTAMGMGMVKVNIMNS